MTQIELAEQIEVSGNFLSQVERGSKYLSLDKLIKVAEVLGIDEKELLDFSRK
ncbi:MAG: helix-turn-helix transcriptional regulator [Selenomonas sp.]|nr:helix-turn-helix transcriptional regulator [Selenomonas sp.]